MERSNSPRSGRFYLLVLLGAGLVLALAALLALRWFEHNYRSIALLKHQIENVFTPIEAIVFVGDSLVSSADWNEYLPAYNIVNRGIYGDDTSDLLSIIPQVLELQPAQLLMLIGINDLNKQMDFEESKANLAQIFDRIDEHTPRLQVVLLELLPTNASWHRQPAPQAVDQYNRFLQQQADQRQYTFAAISSSLAEEQGGLNPGFTHDGIHLNSEGYRVLSQALQPFLIVGNTVRN